MALGVLVLVLFHLLCFRKFYFQNPYVYARSEALEQGFACSRLLGEHLRKYGLLTLIPVDDPYYYPDHAALPFLSTYYPPHRLQAWLGSFLGLNGAWILYADTMVWHFLGASCLTYLLLWRLSMPTWIAILGALTLTHGAYCFKQNSCIVYTVAWVPVLICSALMHSVAIFGISLGLMLLAGYWPIALYAGGLGCLVWLLH